MLEGFFVSSFITTEEMEVQLQLPTPQRKAVDFVIVDEQSEEKVTQVANMLQSSNSNTRLIHLFTPTSQTISRQAFDGSKPGIVRMTKPPRRSRVLQTLAALKDVSTSIHIGPQSEIAKALNDITTAKRSLYGNVLIAEGTLACF